MNQPGYSVDYWSVVSVEVKNEGGICVHSHAFISGTGITLNSSHGKVNWTVQSVRGKHSTSSKRVDWGTVWLWSDCGTWRDKIVVQVQLVSASGAKQHVLILPGLYFICQLYFVTSSCMTAVYINMIYLIYWNYMYTQNSPVIATPHLARLLC